MVKYSFIVPVYNTEKYLKKCLDSLVKQTLKDFEIIVINDGSTDDSIKIIKEYQSKYNNIRVVNQKNQGLSMARNNGVKKASGNYIIFIDSDDYVEKGLLKKVDKNIKNAEILRFQIVTENENGEEKRQYEENPFEITSGKDAFKKITGYRFVETAWCYVFSKDFWNANKFEFTKGVYHEDFCLIPYVIFKASRVCSINYIGYHYVQRSGSIMNDSNYDKTIKKAYDMLSGYKNIKELVKKEDNNNYLLSYMSNCAIIKARELVGKEKKEYINELKKISAFDDVITDSLSRKIKKILMKFNLGLYLKVIK